MLGICCAMHADRFIRGGSFVAMSCDPSVFGSFFIARPAIGSGWVVIGQQCWVFKRSVVWESVARASGEYLHRNQRGDEKNESCDRKSK